MGTGKGVERQIEDCRKLADQLGWVVFDEYVDNDFSAFSGKLRPNYERMLGDIRAGTVDAILVYNLDRLTRRPVEFETFYEVLNAARVTDVRFVTGDMDLGTDDGLFIGRLQAALAAKESAVKSRRVWRKLDQVAAEGRPHGGSNRPFGFEDDKITHKPSEADLIRQLAARFLAGESTRSLTIWMNEQGFPTVRGNPWRTTSVTAILANPRLAGLRPHRGGVAGPALWEPILSIEEHNQILAKMDQKKRSGRRVPRRYLLSGLLRCGKCHSPLYSSPRETTRRYVCMRGPDHGGCGRLTVVAAPLEELIADAVLLRLDTPELASALSGAIRSDADSAALMDTISADTERLDDLARSNADNEITHREWMAARKVIADRIDANHRKLRRATHSSHLVAVLGQGQALSAQWADLNLDRQRAIVDALLDHAVIGPGVSGARALDPERVTPVWRL
jgi:DNA invertase Pin-like site-specific DNA recombinase